MLPRVPSKIAWRILVTVVLTLACLAAATGALNRWSETGPVGAADRRAEAALEGALTQALVTYTVVRSINGVISVVQETDLAVSPAGVGVRLAIGQILDPVNDLIERFSWVMLISTIALGVQQALMHIGTWLGGGVLLAAGLALWAVGLWVPAGKWQEIRRWGIGIAGVALLVRFALPLTTVCTEAAYQRFLADDYQSAATSLAALSRQINTDPSGEVATGEDGPRISGDGSSDEASDPGLIGSLMAYLDGARKQLDLRDRIERLKRQVGEYADWTVRLIVIFLLRTMVLPLLALALIWVGGRIALGHVIRLTAVSVSHRPTQ